MDYLIHYVKLEMWPEIFYVTCLSYFEVKLKLEQTFFQFIYTIKIQIFECFSSILAPSFPHFTKEFESWNFWIPLAFIFC